MYTTQDTHIYMSTWEYRCYDICVRLVYRTVSVIGIQIYTFMCLNESDFVFCVILMYMYIHLSGMYMHIFIDHCDFVICVIGVYYLCVIGVYGRCIGMYIHIYTHLCACMKVTLLCVCHWCVCIYTYMVCILCCSVLQCVAVCCSVLQCVAVCCSVLQCVAVCYSVLQCVRHTWQVYTHIHTLLRLCCVCAIGVYIYTHIRTYLPFCDMTHYHVWLYRVAKSHRILSLDRSFFAEVTYI